MHVNQKTQQRTTSRHVATVMSIQNDVHYPCRMNAQERLADWPDHISSSNMHICEELNKASAKPRTLSGSHSIALHALEALQADATLPICIACGTQYQAPRAKCEPQHPIKASLTRSGPICEDPRQAVPPTGQKWTSLADLGETRKNVLIEDVEDSRLTHIGTEPPFAINQHR